MVTLVGEGMDMDGRGNHDEERHSARRGMKEKVNKGSIECLGLIFKF